MSSENHNLFRKIATIPSRSHSAKNQITRRRQIGAEHSAPELLNSTAVAWVWNPVRPFLPGCQPRSNAWTALRRSLSKQLLIPTGLTTTSPRATQSCRGAKQCFSYLFSISVFPVAGKSRNRIAQQSVRLRPIQSNSQHRSRQPEDCGHPVQARGKHSPDRTASRPQPPAGCRIYRTKHDIGHR